MPAVGYTSGDPRKLNRSGYSKGDVVAANAAGTLTPIPVGADTQVLTADAADAEGVDWQAGGGGGGGVNSVFGRVGNVIAQSGDYTKAQVGLGSVDNTSDVNKPVSTAQAAADALNLKIAQNLADLNDAGTARTNLGLGTAAVANTGTGATNVILGNDARLTDARTPTAHKTSHEPGGSDQLTQLTSANFAAASVDGVAGTASLRTLGVGAQQAAAGSDSRITGAVQSSLVDAKGDLLVGTADNTVARLAVGTDNLVLTADSSVAAGVKWAASSAGAGAIDAYAAMMGLKVASMPYPLVKTKLGLSAGFLLLVLTRNIVAQSISTLGIMITQAGVTASGVNGLALYTEAGTLVDQTGDMSTDFAATGWKTGSLGSSQSLTADTNYYLGILTHFSGTNPQCAGYLTDSGGSLDYTPFNGHYPSVFTTGQASFPSSVTPSGLTVNSGYYFVGGA